MFSSICENSNALSAILLVKDIINIISIFVPIILILMLSVEILKMVISNDNNAFKNGIRGIVIKAIAAVAVFFVPVLVNLLLGMLNVVAFNNSICWINATSESIADYRALEEARRKVDEAKTAEEKKKAEEARKALEELREQARIENEKKAEEAKKNDNNSSSSSGYNGVFPATKYDLTESQLIALARVCMAEQGSVKGAAAEASLMANLFERTTKYGSGGTGLYKYVRTGGWFSNAASHMDHGSYTPEILAAVKDVLVNGNRTLPTYVNEHDCWLCNSRNTCSDGKKGDICKLVTNGVTQSSSSDVKNRSNYIQDKTVVYNVYGSKYTFYTFPESNSDPFGYTGK